MNPTQRNRYGRQLIFRVTGAAAILLAALGTLNCGGAQPDDDGTTESTESTPAEDVGVTQQPLPIAHELATCPGNAPEPTGGGTAVCRVRTCGKCFVSAAGQGGLGALTTDTCGGLRGVFGNVVTGNQDSPRWCMILVTPRRTFDCVLSGVTCSPTLREECP